MHFLGNESNLPTYVKNGLIKYQISKNEGGGWRTSKIIKNNPCLLDSKEFGHG